jgi:hypothetical protein
MKGEMPRPEINRYAKCEKYTAESGVVQPMTSEEYVLSARNVARGVNREASLNGENAASAE